MARRVSGRGSRPGKQLYFHTVAGLADLQLAAGKSPSCLSFGDLAGLASDVKQLLGVSAVLFGERPEGPAVVSLFRWLAEIKQPLAAARGFWAHVGALL